MKRQELRMLVLHQTLFVHKLEKRNHPPECRRCEVKRRSHKHPLLTIIRKMLGSLSPCIKFEVQAHLWTWKTLDFELSRAQTEVSHSRSSVERNKSTDTTDAEDLQHFREDTFSLARANLGHLAEIDRILFKQNWRQRAFDLNKKTRKML